VNYVGDGMQTNNWTAATKKYYGFTSLSDLQVTWVEWVRQGSPDVSAVASAEEPQQGTDIAARSASEGRAASIPAGQMPGTQMASLTRPRPTAAGDVQPSAWQTVGAQRERSIAAAQHFETPPQPTSFPAESYVTNPKFAAEHSSVSRPVSEGWYAKRRDQAQAVLQSSPDAADAQDKTIPAPPTRTIATPEPLTPEPLTPVGSQSAGAFNAAPPGQFSPGMPLKSLPAGGPAPSDRRVLMEWSRADQPGTLRR
jgi:hypothetical protein